MSNPVIVALDDMERDPALQLAKQLSGLVWGFKVNDMLMRYGATIVSDLKEHGNVFADAKLHDIPNTVKNSVNVLNAAGADLITVHTSGGVRMMEAAKDAASTARILGVTVLTSLIDSDASQVYGDSAGNTVLRLANLAAEANIDGIVCSPLELKAIQEKTLLASLIKVTPGIRPSWHGSQDDQSRVQTPGAALELGADFLVVGRPITQSESPCDAAQRIVQEL
jgi:orotidine-5'-phosphate decarboxylase